MIDLSRLSPKELLQHHAAVSEELRTRGITRSSNNPKAADPAELSNLYTERYGKMAQVAESFEHAMEIAERAITREDLIVITGSFYLIGEAKVHFDRKAAAVAVA